MADALPTAGANAPQPRPSGGAQWGGPNAQSARTPPTRRRPDTDAIARAGTPT
jgi:hypothetical protein